MRIAHMNVEAAERSALPGHSPSVSKPSPTR